VSDVLTILAGRSALAHIRENGLHPADIRIVAGAAGGPKFLVLSQLDRYLFGHMLVGHTEPIFVLGSSVGAWRAAAIAQRDPLTAIERLEDAYIEEEYAGWKPNQVSAGCWRVLGRYVDDAAMTQVLEHPVYRVGWLVARARFLNAFEARFVQSLGLGATAIGNLINPRLARLGFRQMLFRDPREAPPYLARLRQIDLSPENFRASLIATGAVPLVMEGVPDIAGAPRGVYRDGGVLDYHLDIDYGIDEGLVLYPHFSSRVVPGWFDKLLKWRKPERAHFDRVVLIAPSDAFIASLPDGKIPDRIDFETYDGRDSERRQVWRTCVARCIELRDALVEAIDGGKIRQWARAFPWERES